METPSRKERKGQDNQNLRQHLNNLEEEYRISFKHKQSKPITLSRSLTDSSTMIRSLDLLDNSPRFLISSLQHRRSPSGAWKVRNNDLVVEEILRDRKAAIESGNFKGRKLFDSAKTTAEVGFDGWDSLDQESEVRSMFSYDSDDEREINDSNEELCPVICHSVTPSSSSSTSSHVFDECMEKEMVAVEKERAEAVAVEDEEKEKRIVNGVKSWVAIGIAVCAFGVISVWRFSGYGDGNEVILVPT